MLLFWFINFLYLLCDIILWLIFEVIFFVFFIFLWVLKLKLYILLIILLVFNVLYIFGFILIIGVLNDNWDGYILELFLFLMIIDCLDFFLIVILWFKWIFINFVDDCIFVILVLWFLRCEFIISDVVLVDILELFLFFMMWLFNVFGLIIL